jgi:protein TonB
MKAVACFLLCSAMLAPGLQTQTPSSTTMPPHHIQISPTVAEKLLVHKAEIHPPFSSSRVTGTVIVAVEIDRNGNVLDPKVVSGPHWVRKAVLDAVQKYRYKPYLLNGNAVDVETTVSVFVGIGK